MRGPNSHQASKNKRISHMGGEKTLVSSKNLAEASRPPTAATLLWRKDNVHGLYTV